MMQDDPADVTDSTVLSDESANSDSIAEPSPSTGQSLSRRTLLKGTASAAVGMTGLATISGTAAAGNWGECHHNPPRAPSWFGYLSPWEQSEHNLPNANNGLSIYIHGFLGTRQGAVDTGHEVWRKIRDEGYPHHACFSFVWPAGNGFTDWGSAKDNSYMAGRWLGDFINGRGWTDEDGKNINIICHSLGARVALECIKTLHEKYQKSIDTIHFLGGAVDVGEVSFEYNTALEHGCGWTHNWYSESDPVLRKYYVTWERTQPIGLRAHTGNIEMTSYPTGMKQHCQYMDYEYGVINDVARVVGNG
ncbi:DUF726 domain-containing protein [Halocatena salina]|uniref:DUF726 domain-containing protein n=1 Tax=Halocatena salina TaxID=2934340 RepID=A0A8U0A676_9EURY|nr:DUF726 domain-containing protein [Halocatena salina]UPM44665.1 DUF726 domain-containing protein [Halocatena salina]